jgi:hypothetical protein
VDVELAVSDSNPYREMEGQELNFFAAYLWEGEKMQEDNERALGILREAAKDALEALGNHEYSMYKDGFRDAIALILGLATAKLDPKQVDPCCFETKYEIDGIYSHMFDLRLSYEHVEFCEGTVTEEGLAESPDSEAEFNLLNVEIDFGGGFEVFQEWKDGKTDDTYFIDECVKHHEAKRVAIHGN